MSERAVPEENGPTEHNPTEHNPTEHESVAVEQQAENAGLSTLTNLGNEAIALGLIAGHGHHQGQYEIIRNGEIVTFSPGEAVTYLQNLIQSANSSASNSANPS